MSTRCTVTVRDSESAFTLYRHSDGYPDTKHGVLETLKLALSYAWPLPRFEPDEFAAAIVAAWKKPAIEEETMFGSRYRQQGGNIRFANGRDSIGDTEFHYDVKPGPRGTLKVTVLERVWSDDESKPDSWRKVKTASLSAADQSPVPFKPLDSKTRRKPAKAHA